MLQTESASAGLPVPTGPTSNPVPDPSPDFPTASLHRGHTARPESDLRHVSGESGGIAVLWIDDTSDTGLTRLLSLEGFRVTSAQTGEAGLALAVAHAYDVIVVDLHLPDVHGLTVLERIRAHGISTPALAITGYYLDPETESHTRAAGATAFKYKPIWAAEAADLLRTVVGIQGSGEASVTPSGVGPGSPTGGETSIVRLLAALDRLASTAGDAHDEEHAHEALLDVLLSALSDPALPLAGFRGCAEALRATMSSPPGVRMGRLAARARDAVGERARRPRTPRDSRVRQALDILLEKPRWFEEGDLAETLIISRSRLAHLLHDDLDVDYRTLRRLVVMKAAAIDVLTTTEHFAQIAHHLGMHAGTFDEVFNETCGCCPRELRRLWKRLRP